MWRWIKLSGRKDVTVLVTIVKDDNDVEKRVAREWDDRIYVEEEGKERKGKRMIGW